MSTASKVQRNWNDVKTKLRERWTQLNSDDLHHFDGELPALVDLVERKTGEARSDIEQFIDEAGRGNSLLAKAKEAAVGYGMESVSEVQKFGAQVAETATNSVQATTSIVKENPFRATAICIGAGVVCGVILGMSMGRR